MDSMKKSSTILSIIDPRLIGSGRSPFRFNKTNGDDERLALYERFRLEGLDVRKLSDGQRLLFVWRWLVDAEINGQSLRHQIEKMRAQHQEELQEVEEYIEQVWKLSTERLILLEEENRFLRQNHSNDVTVPANEHSDPIYQSISYPEDDDADDSDVELQKCLYSGLRLQKPTSIESQGKNCSEKYPFKSNNGRLVNSMSTSSLFPTNVANNLCDSLKLKSSKSCWQFPNSSASVNPSTNVDHDGNANFCENSPHKDLLTLKQTNCQLKEQLEKVEEHNFVLEKLNRSLEIENENFAYKLAESENRSNQLERKIFLLEKECRQLKSKNNSLWPKQASNFANEERRLIEELSEKVKSVEEELDHRAQMYEELEAKYRKQKERHKETLWKLKNYIDPSTLGDSNNNSVQTPVKVDLEHETNSSDSGLVTMDPLEKLSRQSYNNRR